MLCIILIGKNIKVNMSFANVLEKNGIRIVSIEEKNWFCLFDV